MNSPTVSVVIPVYNRVDYLREALDSVAAQTFRDLESIVIDDGSTDDIAAGVSGHPAKPRLLHQPHRGPAAARNRGIADARGRYVAFLDSDDLWLPEKLTRFVAALDADPKRSIYYGPMQPIDAARRPVQGRSKPRHEGAITGALFASCFVDVPTVVCRRQLLQRTGGFDESLPVCEDYDLWLRISLVEPFGYIPEPLAQRRLHDARLSKSDMHRNLSVKATMLERFYEAHRGDGCLDDAAARARLARVFFLAGREAFHAGRYPQAIELCRRSRFYGRPSVRSLFFSAAAGALALVDAKGSRTN